MEEKDGVTGLAGRTKVGMFFRFGRLLKQLIRGVSLGTDENGKFGLHMQHPHTDMAKDKNFGKTLIKEALKNDQIEGKAGAEGAKAYSKS